LDASSSRVALTAALLVASCRYGYDSLALDAAGALTGEPALAGAAGSVDSGVGGGVGLGGNSALGGAQGGVGGALGNPASQAGAGVSGSEPGASGGASGCVVPTEIPSLATQAGCPDNYVLVSASTASFIGPLQNDFCVAKFEMRAVRTADGVLEPAGSNAGAPLPLDQFTPASRPDGLPWQFIAQSQAEAECASLGPGHHLITNDEWMTLASTIEAQPANWSGCSRGQVGLFTGLDGRNPVSNLDDPYSDTGATEQEAYGAGGEKRRVFYLPNGERIWDLAGAHEWVTVLLQGTPVLLSVYAGDGQDSAGYLGLDFDTQEFLDLIQRSADDPNMPPGFVAVRPAMVIPQSTFDAASALYTGAAFALGYGRFGAKWEFRDNKGLMRGGDGGLFGFNTYAFTGETNWPTAFRCAKSLP
jgi:hypothetical protein